MKKFIHNMKLSTKFNYMFGLMLLIVMGVSVVTIYGSLSLQKTVKRTSQISEFLNETEELYLGMTYSHDAIKQYMLSGNIKFKKEFEDSHLKVDDLLEVVQNHAKKSMLPSSVTDDLNIVFENYQKWVSTIVEKQLKVAQDPYTVDMARLIQISPENEELWDEISKDFDMVSDELNKEVARYNALQSQRLTTMLLSSVFGAILLFVVCVLVALFSKRFVVQPLVKITAEFEKLAQYNLSGHIDVMSQDEIGAISGAFNHVVQRLREIVGSVRQASSQMAAASEEMSSNMKQMSSMGESQTVASTQISEAVRESTQTAQEINRLANSTKENVDAIAGSADEAQTCMNHLHQNSEQIANVLGVIQGIAEQVNLLALNAAIEAARAGDAGRGFAVVADEVRKLAGHTTESTSEIKDTIRSLHDNVTATGDSLLKITGAIKNISQEVILVTESVGQQSAAMEEISSTVDGFLAQVTNMDVSIKEMEEVSGTIATEATQLDSQVEVFKMS